MGDQNILPASAITPAPTEQRTLGQGLKLSSLLLSPVQFQIPFHEIRTPHLKASIIRAPSMKAHPDGR